MNLVSDFDIADVELTSVSDVRDLNCVRDDFLILNLADNGHHKTAILRRYDVNIRAFVVDRTPFNFSSARNLYK